MSISSSIGHITTFSEWVEVYKKIIYWELELESIDDNNMLEILLTQKKKPIIIFSSLSKKLSRPFK